MNCYKCSTSFLTTIRKGRTSPGCVYVTCCLYAAAGQVVSFLYACGCRPSSQLCHYMSSAAGHVSTQVFCMFAGHIYLTPSSYSSPSCLCSPHRVPDPRATQCRFRVDPLHLRISGEALLSIQRYLLPRDFRYLPGRCCLGCWLACGLAWESWPPLTCCTLHAVE